MSDWIKNENVNEKKQKEPKEPKKKICFVSSLYGSNIKKYDMPGKFKRLDNYDYLLITNFKSKELETSWDVITLNLDKEKFRCDIKEKGGYVIRSRYPKFMMWKIFKDYPDKFKDYQIQDYEIIVYCDAFLSPRSDVNWIDILETLKLPQEVLEKKIRHYSPQNCNPKKKVVRLIQDLHQNKLIRDKGIKEEIKLIVEAKKDKLENMLITLQLMAEIMGEKSKKKIKQGRYCLNTCLAYNLKCHNTLKYLESFWRIYNLGGRKNNVPITFRDQPWWNFWLIYKNRLTLVYKEEIEYDKKIELYLKTVEKEKARVLVEAEEEVAVEEEKVLEVSAEEEVLEVIAEEEVLEVGAEEEVLEDSGNLLENLFLIHKFEQTGTFKGHNFRYY